MLWMGKESADGPWLLFQRAPDQGAPTELPSPRELSESCLPLYRDERPAELAGALLAGQPIRVKLVVDD